MRGEADARPEGGYFETKIFKDGEATEAIVGGTTVTPLAAQADLPLMTSWVDAPRLPRAKLYSAVMKGKANVKVELYAQGDLRAKVQLFNAVKKDWPDAIFSAPNDVGLLKNPLIKNALALDKYLTPAPAMGFRNGSRWCKSSTGTHCAKKNLTQTIHSRRKVQP